MRCSGAVVVLVCWLAGCSLVELKQTSGYQFNDSSINPQVFNAITPQQTHRQWLLHHIGHPTQILDMGKGEQQYIYHMNRLESRSTRVFLLFEKRHTEIAPEVHVVQLKNNLVTRHWIKQPVLPPQTPPESETLAVQRAAADTTPTSTTEPEPMIGPDVPVSVPLGEMRKVEPGASVEN